MDINYIKFIIVYDFAQIFDKMNLACDEAYKLTEEIAKRYIKHTRENGIEQYYETLYEYCEELSFSEIWKEMKSIKS